MKAVFFLGYNTSEGRFFMKLKGRSGIIIWIMALALLAGTVIFASMYREFDSIGGYLLIVIIMAASSALFASFILRNFILVTENTITVCFGITTTVIETASVTSLKKVTSLMASASASAKRIEIRYADGIRKDFIHVSPKDEEAFIQAVCTYNPKVSVINK